MSNSQARELIQINSLIHESKYDEALQILKNLEKKQHLNPQDVLMCRSLKVKILNQLGQSKEAFDLAKKIFQVSQELAMPLQSIDILIHKAHSASWLGKFDECLQIIENAEILLKSLTHVQSSDFTLKTASLMLEKSESYRWKGSSANALKYAQQSLTSYKEIGDKLGIARSLMAIGLAHHAKGNLDQALKYYQQALEIGEKSDFKVIIALYHNTIGWIHRLKGELDQALDHYQASLKIREEIKNNQFIALSFSQIAEINHAKGELDRALENFEKSLAIFEKTQNNFWCAHILFHLVYVATNKNALQQASEYLQRLHKINDLEKSKIISQRTRLAEALLLKRSKRAPKRGKAEVLLREVVEEEIIENEVTVLALLHLCELLFFELHITSEEESPEILDELRSLVERLQIVNKQYHSYWLLSETYLLQSKLALLELDIQGAQQFLDQAQLTAEEKGLKMLHTKLAREQADFRNQLTKWQQLALEGAPMRERLELTQLEIQIIQMVKRKLEVTEQDVLDYAQEVQQRIEAMKEEQEI